MDSLINVFGKNRPAAQVAVTTPERQAEEVVADTTEIVFPIRLLPSTHSDINTAILSLNYSQADALAKKQIAAAKRKKESTEALERIPLLCHTGENGLRGVDRVTIVDSIVVDKQTFLSAYPLSADAGTLSLSEKGDIVQFQTQINGIVFRPERNSTEIGNTPLQIVRYYLEGERLTEPTFLDGLGVEGDINYPFLMPDGQTFYFAARCEEGYGNYDLYATRYDSDSKRFYHAENMGFPYNSYANDYMLVIDEAANLGWFASDRYQPMGKVCIYTFIPNESRKTIDYETADMTELRAAASLRSIASISLSDEEKQAKAEALKRMKALTTTASSAQHKDFEFVVNDTKTCYSLSDFTSPEARQQCSEWLQKTKNLLALTEQLQQMRETSPTATQQILHLETRIAELQNEVHMLEKSIRAEELLKPS